MLLPIQWFQETVCSVYLVWNPVRWPFMSSKYSLRIESVSLFPNCRST